MRQVGILGAAALLALREGPSRLAIDHARARQVADAVQGLRPVGIDLNTVESNILMVDTPDHDAQDLMQFLNERQILAMVFGPKRIRMVFHRDQTDDHVQRCIEGLTDWARQRS
jgi:threonine aldolase